MASVNLVIIVGYLGDDPTTRYLPEGTCVCNISVATSEVWKDKNSGERKQSTEWHRISMFGKIAEIANEYLRKGSLAYFEGKLQTRKWQDKEGHDRYTTEIVARKLTMLGSKSQDEREDRPATARATAPGARPDYGYPQEKPPAQKPGSQKRDGHDAFQDMDSDIPF